MSEKILIDGHQFTAITSVNLTKAATLCKHPVEDQTEISDHTILNPIVFEFEIQLFNLYSEHVVITNVTTGQTESQEDLVDEYEILDNLYKNKVPFTLESHRGTFENLVISKLSDQKTISANTTSATVTIEQVRIGTSKTVATVETPKNEATVPTTSEDGFPGGLHVVSLTVFSGAGSLKDSWNDKKSAKENLQGFSTALESAGSVSSLL